MRMSLTWIIWAAILAAQDSGQEKQSKDKRLISAKTLGQHSQDDVLILAA